MGRTFLDPAKVSTTVRKLKTVPGGMLDFGAAMNVALQRDWLGAVYGVRSTARAALILSCRWLFIQWVIW